jgi:hypothetical protein
MPQKLGIRQHPFQLEIALFDFGQFIKHRSSRFASRHRNKKGKGIFATLCPYRCPWKNLAGQFWLGAPRSVLQAVFLAELLDPAGRIDELLFAGEKRVAIGANLHVNVARRGTCLGHIAAGAGNRGIFVFGMDGWLHKNPLE